MKSKNGCRKCTDESMKKSVTAIAVWTGLLGLPLLLTLFYWSSLRPLISDDPCEPNTSQRRPRAKAWLYFCVGRLSETPIWKEVAPLIAVLDRCKERCKERCTKFATFLVRHNPKDYIKIVVSFYQVSTAFVNNIDVRWPESVVSIWRFFSFLTMEVFKLYGYDCMFGGVDYLGRLLVVTTVPILVVFVFCSPWLVTFIGFRPERRSRVFDSCCNSVMWIVYLIYPLLCLMSVQGFKCMTVEGMHLLAADMKEPCPWNKNERGSWIFVWSAFSMLVYAFGIPLALLVCLLRLDVPYLARLGRGEAIFRQMLGLYIKQRDEMLCARFAVYLGGHVTDTQDGPIAKESSWSVEFLHDRASLLYRETSDNGKNPVTSQRLLSWLQSIGITGEEPEEIDEIFPHFDNGKKGNLDEQELVKLVRFLVEAYGRIHAELSLHNVSDRKLCILSDVEWDGFLENELDDGHVGVTGGGFDRFFLNQLKKKPQKRSQSSLKKTASMIQSTFSRSTSGLSDSSADLDSNVKRAASDQFSTNTHTDSWRSLRSEISSVHFTAQDEAPAAGESERDAMIEALLRTGGRLMRRGAFALPRLSWHADESHPAEKRVRSMIGFMVSRRQTGRQTGREREQNKSVAQYHAKC